MSLRIFHIIFISASVVLCIFVGLWGVRDFATGQNMTGLVLAAIFFPSAVVLVVYGRRVYQKLKELP